MWAIFIEYCTNGRYVYNTVLMEFKPPNRATLLPIVNSRSRNLLTVDMDLYWSGNSYVSYKPGYPMTINIAVLREVKAGTRTTSRTKSVFLSVRP